MSYNDKARLDDDVTPGGDTISQSEADSGQMFPGDDDAPVADIEQSTVIGEKISPNLEFTGGIRVPQRIVTEEAGNRFLNSLMKSTSPARSSSSPSFSLDDWISEMEKDRPETEEEREERERRERRTMFLSNVADVLGNMHRAYSHARDVKPMDLPNMSDRSRARFDRLRQERESRRQAYLNNGYRLMTMDLNRDAESRRQEQQKLALRRQEWRELQAQNQFDLQKEKSRIEEEYKKGQLTLRERELALRELEVYNHVYGTSTQTRVQDGPRGRTVTTTTTTRNGGAPPDSLLARKKQQQKSTTTVPAASTAPVQQTSTATPAQAAPKPAASNRAQMGASTSRGKTGRGRTSRSGKLKKTGGSSQGSSSQGSSKYEKTRSLGL